MNFFDIDTSRFKLSSLVDDSSEMTTSNSTQEACSGEGSEQKEPGKEPSTTSDNDNDNNDSGNTEKGGETKLSKRQLRKIRKEENALKYRAEKR